MTAIAAVSHRHKIWMACDSRNNAENLAVQQARSKIMQFGSVLVGLSGSNNGDRVAHMVDWAARDLDAEITKAAEAIGASGDIELLIGRAGKLYYWEGEGIWETGRYAAAGSGAAVCLGYLRGTVGFPPQDRVRGAIEAAIEHCPSCGGKIWVARS